ncbi:MAG: hypothetical protein DPW09_30455 [Anaerolineae bacterium]|nr:hypothetical protein [Anaerolineales bacterium]MCQ3977771.1 hypothetical protein [Anaerolineae bacterium]
MVDPALPLELSYPPLLATKLYPPRRRANWVSRPRLVARLNQDFNQRKLTLITAPTGFGKTTLVSEWLTEKDEGGRQKDETGEVTTFHPSSFFPHPFKTAWLSLDKEDNDPARFLSYLVAAMQTVYPALGQSSFTAPSLPLETALTTLVNEIAALPETVVLVLDDYHLIEAETIHRGLIFLLDHLPAQLHLVILSRTTPPLPLGHLRARGQLLELQAADLRFTSAEAAEFLNRVMGLSLAAADIETLEARTEGWIAGLQLAALSLQGLAPPDISGFLAGFSGSHRYIADYLVEEVLQRQPEVIQDFLLQTSILDRLCGPLCDAVLGKAEGGRMKDENFRLHPSSFRLEQLEQANLFITPLDDERRWYRYHHLFGDLLRNLLQKKIGPPGVAALHRRAAEWFEAHGLPAEAVSHALAAADAPRAARLVEQHARSLLSRSEMTTLLSWLQALPAELIRSQAQLSLFQAWASALTGQLDVVETYLQGAEGQPGETAAIRGSVAYFRRDMPQAIALYRQAFDLLPADNSFLRGAVALSLGVAYSWTGQVAQAGEALTQARTISQASGNWHVALTASWNLAQLEIEQGHLRQAADLCRQALELPASSLPAAGGAYVCLGSLLYEWNDLEAAVAQVEQGIKLGEQGADLAIVALGYLTLARIRLAQADSSGALEAAQQAEQLAQRYNSRYWTAQATAYQARVWLAEGQLEAAQRWAQSSALSPQNPVSYLAEIEYLTLARLLLAQKKETEAIELLGRIRQAAEAGGRTGRVIETLILLSLAYQASADTEQAVTSLDQALALAEPEGYLRTFLDEGPTIVKLLERMKAEGGRQKNYLDELLRAAKKFAEKPFHPSSLILHPSLVEPLSERELELLGLITAGLSNSEIAEKLVVTVGTVKWHLNNIYGKLGVRSRTQAVARARELGLL